MMGYPRFAFRDVRCVCFAIAVVLLGVGFASAGTVTGTVMSGGGPVDGAHVWMQHLYGWGYADAWTNVDGSYTISGASSGSYYMVAEKSGLAREYRFHVPVPDVGTISGQDFDLGTNPGSISGEVTKHSGGAPVVGLDVYLHMTDDPNNAGEEMHDWYHVTGVQTDGSGNYTLSDLPERRYILRTGDTDGVGDHYVEARQYNVAVIEGAQTANMDFSVREAGLIYGYVRTPLGDPIPNAWLNLHTEMGEDMGYWPGAGTDVDGRYEFYALPSPGKFHVVKCNGAEVGPDCYAMTEAELAGCGLAGTHGPDFTLSLAGTIQGRIVNEIGEGLPDVGVCLQGYRNGKEIEYWCRTDADGYYDIPYVPTDIDVYVSIDGEEGVLVGSQKYASGEQHVGPFSVSAGGITTAPDMVVPHAGRIIGLVTDRDGTPIVGVEVLAEGVDLDGNSTMPEDSVSDALGQYSLDYAAPGRYVLMVWKEGWTAEGASVVSVGPDEEVVHDIVLVGMSEAAVATGMVNNFGAFAADDGAGVMLPSYVAYECEEAGIAMTQVVTATLEEPMAESAWVDGLTMRYVVDFSVPDDGYADYFEAAPGEVVGEYGAWLRAGRCAVIVSKEVQDRAGWGGCMIFHDCAVVNAVEGQTYSGVDLTPKTELGNIEGDITVPGGYTEFAQEWCAILAFNQETGEQFPLPNAVAWAGYTTTYKFTGIPVGTYTLRCVARNLLTVVYEDVDVIKGGTRVQDVVFEAGGAIAATVETEVGATPLPGATVRIVETGVTATTDSNGECTIKGLATDTYTVEGSLEGYAALTEEVAVVSGATTNTTLQMSAAVGDITGTVSSVGTPISGARVVAYNTGTRETEETSTVGGEFTFTGLAAGTYVLGAEAAGFEVAQYPPGDTLTLGAGEVYDLAGQTPDHVELTGIKPELSCHSTVGAILSIWFESDVELLSNPTFSVTQGAGTLDTSEVDYTVSPKQFEVTYTPDAGDTVVVIHMEEGVTAVVPGQAAAEDFSFEVSADLTQTASTNVTNAMGADLRMMGAQDMTSVYIPPMALAGTPTDTTAIGLEVLRYGDPGDAAAGTDETTASAVYDFQFDDENVTVELDRTVTITVSFEVPEGMTEEAFMATVRVGYYNESAQEWRFSDSPGSGISNVRVNWNSHTIMFDVTHLSKFAIFVPPAGPRVIPENPVVRAGDYLHFTSTLGPGEEWSFESNESGGTIDADSGLYEAGVTPGEDVVKGTVGLESATTTVTVTSTARVAGTVGPETSMDVDGGGLSLADVIFMLKCVVGIETPTTAQAEAADFDANGALGLADVINALRVVVGLAPVV